MINKHRLMKYYFILFIALLILLPFSQSEHQLSVDASSKSATEERGKTSLEEIELEQLRKEKLIDEADLQRKKEALLDEIGFDELDEDASLEEKIDTILQYESIDECSGVGRTWRRLSVYNRSVNRWKISRKSITRKCIFKRKRRSNVSKRRFCSVCQRFKSARYS